MNDGLLSQEEIEALLNSGTIDSAPAEGGSDSPAQGDAEAVGDLSDMERDALGEIGNISMGSAATTLSILLGRKVSITTPRVSMGTISAIKDQYPLPYLIVEVGYTVGIEGNNLLAIREQDALIIANLMMGGDGTNPAPQLDEIAMSAVGEAMNQMMGAVATSLSTMFNKKVDISPPTTEMIDLGSEEKISKLVEDSEPIVKVAFRMEVEGLIDSEIMQILPVNVAKDMVTILMGGGVEEEAAPEPASQPVAAPTPPPAPQPAPQPAAMPQPEPQPMMQQPMMQQPMMQQPMMQQPMMQQPMMQQPMYAMPQSPNIMGPQVPVQPVQFAPLTGAGLAPAEGGNLGLIMDVPLQVTVELGRTRKVIKDILEMSAGSIIELDRLAGEPVDILVNGKLLAKGEVVVIDENFGVRITEIVSQLERARTIQ